jgi:hypothetical protein
MRAGLYIKCSRRLIAKVFVRCDHIDFVVLFRLA